ncbi:ABC transporter ATP-binding protein [Streptomyces litchfieldiae]|uniref:ABC transporter ATP-binding protein n=1 Tax=Streptomyces litchfieldiae TaxID=3075543 RepID=A0ABU2MVC6_9ACTN|nr:ABC transporter ATP-binding protein [Streptomyces sp. DSM 44938]MDT0345436.1 ABC transporter ATP-binding protein [Streptomyces sp. DSM 44938]
MRSFPDRLPPDTDVHSPARYLLRLVADHRRSLALGVAYGIVCTLAQALVPAAVGRAIDDGLIDRDQSALVAWGAVVLSLGLVQAFSGILRDRAALTSQLGASYQTVQLVTRQASRLGAELPRRATAGEVVSVGAADVGSIGSAMFSSARGTGAVVAIVTVAVLMLTASWGIGLAVLVGVPLMTWLVALLLRPLHRRQEGLRDQQGHLTTRALDIVGGLRVLRGIGGEEFVAERYRAQSQEVRRAGVRVARVEVWLDGCKVLLPGLLVAFVVWLSAHAVLDDRISAGQLVAFYGYTVFLSGPLRWLTDSADQFTRAHVAAKRVVRLLAQESGLSDGPRAADALDGSGDLADRESGVVIRGGLLTGVACTEPAEAAVLADRLGRYAESAATAGGVPLRDVPVTAVRDRVLVTGNDDRFFAGPLRAELDTTGRDSAALEAAVDTASARDITDALPEGLDTVLTHGGREFSGGQQQRLRLARALCADPPALLLVEPTSAVDAHTESVIASRLSDGRAGRTTAVFTTSPIVLDRADRVLLVDGLRVIAEGTHSELLAEPRYRDLVFREDPA